jgi:hypothetical protein
MTVACPVALVEADGVVSPTDASGAVKGAQKPPPCPPVYDLQRRLRGGHAGEGTAPRSVRKLLHPDQNSRISL